ncbi:MAG: hypothetical protein JOY77_09095 [Alphaproteobacteria bacterium]|nr:hypothetical protein [Alphaproteobacteria bacterium]
MDQTRRTLFKTSVLSAIGAVAAASLAKASDLGMNRAILRARKADGTDIDILLVGGASNTFKAYPLSSHVIHGTPMTGVNPTLTPPSSVTTYTVFTEGVSPAPTLTIQPDGTAQFDNLGGLNAWNEIGGRRGDPSIDAMHSRHPR